MPTRLRKTKARASDAAPGPVERSLDELMRDGVVVIDKPMGPTSHQVTSWVREMLDARKAAHGGTLDPRVTGVLPVGVGVSVRAMDTLHHGTKEYVGVMKMHGNIDLRRLEDVLGEFTDEIIQVPPVRSAVKRAERTRRIHSIELLETRGRNVLFRVECDSGTYVRSLCVDIGDALGIGAHLQDLRRTRAGTLTEGQAVSLHDLRDALEARAEGDDGPLSSMFHPTEVLLEHIPGIEVKDSAVDAICHGADLALPGVVSLDDGVARGGIVAITTSRGEAVGLGRALMDAKEVMARSEGIVAKTTRVLMPAGTYRKGWTTSSGRTVATRSSRASSGP